MSIDEYVQEKARQLESLIRNNKKFLVLSHLDADGIASGTVLFLSLVRKRARVTLRIIPELDYNYIDSLRDSKYDFIIISDLGSSLLPEIRERAGSNFLLIDHHLMQYKDEQNVLNPWNHGIDGGKEACSTTLAYLLCSELDQRNMELSYLAIVASLADRQDVGAKRSLIGLNRKVLEESMRQGLVSVHEDILLPGRETRPVHESLSLLNNPYVPGISGNRDAAYSALLKREVVLKKNGLWRTVSDLTKEEKSKLVEIILEFLQGSEFSPDDLIGEIYILENEERQSQLRDARDFGTLLNACGRMGRHDLGIAICSGDRNKYLQEALSVLSEYRQLLNSAIESIVVDERRTRKVGSFAILDARGIVQDKLLGPFTSILTSTPQFKDYVVIALTDSSQGEIKFSARIGDGFKGNASLGEMLSEAARECRGVGGGHKMAAGAKISQAYYQKFLSIIEEMIARNAEA